MTGFRKLLLNVHLWVGLAACLLLFMLGLTGAMLVFENNLDHVFNPSLSYVKPQPERLPLEQLQAAVLKQFPHSRALVLQLSPSSPSPDLAYAFMVAQGKERDEVFIDQYTGRILGRRVAGSGFVTKVHRFHTTLLAGPAWSAISGWASVLMCLLALSGIYLWWPRKIFKPNFRASGRRINFDLHNSIGFYASVFAFLLAFTGVFMHWEGTLSPLLSRLTHSTIDQIPTKVSSAPAAPGAVPLSLDQLVELALAQMPGARVTQISLAVKPADCVRIWMKYPEDGTPAGRTWVFLDQYTGKVLTARSSRTVPWAASYVRSWNREIHTGDIFGWPTRILACLASLAVAFLSISGPVIWLLKKRKKVSPVSKQKSSETVGLEEQLV